MISSNSDNSESRLHFLSIKFTDRMKIVEVRSRGKKFQAVKEGALINEWANAANAG